MLYFLHDVMIYQHFTLIVKYFIHVFKGRSSLNHKPIQRTELHIIKFQNLHESLTFHMAKFMC